MEVLDNLLKWEHTFTIKDSMGNDYKDSEGNPIVVYQRIVGDAEVDLARQTALRASAMKRRMLTDPSSLDRMTLIPDYELLDTDSLKGLIVLSELMDLREKATRELVFPFPEPPKSSANLEEQEKYQEAIDKYFEEREDRLQKETDQLAKLRRKELNSYSRAELERNHEQVTINNVCREEMLSTFNEMVAYQGTYIDPKYTTRAFSSYNAFKAAASYLKRQVVEQYAKLEVSGQTLKK